MNLFKRLVISLFPTEITNNSVNPAHMFVSFISTKDFFSIINRKIVENYKSNLFDISLEPLEVQIGLDQKVKLSKQELTHYYAYCSVANINGYTFYNLSNISCCMALASSVLLKDIFQKYDEKIFTNFLFTIYLLPYIFASGVKKFPYQEREKNYNRLVELTFEFFKTNSQKKQQKEIEKIKKEILSHPSIFFVLMELLIITNNILLLNPEFSLANDNTILSWIANGKKNTPHYYDTNLHTDELQLLENIFPNDILPKYLFSDMNSFLVVEKIIQEIYDKDILTKYAKSIKEKKGNIQEFIQYITDTRLFKKGFFIGGKKYISEFFYKDDIQGEIGHDIDEIISEIGENPGDIEKFQIPERIKQESRIMEKLLNFYITLLAGFASAKSDSFYLRIYHQTLLNNITTSLRANKQLNGNFRKNYYQLYNTNTQYYEKIYEGIKNNKKKITFHYNTIDTQLIPKGIIGMFQEHFIATILQEINPRETKLYIKKLILLQEFKAIFGKRISVFLKKDTNSFIEIVYEDLSKLLSTPELIIHELKKQLNENNIFNLKENLYTIDFRIWREILQTLHNTTITNLDNSTIIGITAILRETTLGIILLIQYMKKQQYSHLIPTMMEIYTQNILGIPEGIAAQMKNSILTIREKYSPIFNLRIHLDDNKEFLDIAMKHISILEKKNPEQRTQLTNEHILWMKGLLHTLSMYNKRYLLPK